MRSLSNQKNMPAVHVVQDWHIADIVASLKKAGTNFSKLARENGYSRSTLRNALYRPYPKAERIIAGTIGVEPSEIWPSRYQQELALAI